MTYINVSGGGDALQNAIDAANPGDTLVAVPGNYSKIYVPPEKPHLTIMVDPALPRLQIRNEAATTGPSGESAAVLLGAEYTTLKHIEVVPAVSRNESEGNDSVGILIYPGGTESSVESAGHCTIDDVLVRRDNVNVVGALGLKTLQPYTTLSNSTFEGIPDRWNSVTFGGDCLKDQMTNCTLGAGVTIVDYLSWNGFESRASELVVDDCIFNVGPGFDNFFILLTNGVIIRNNTINGVGASSLFALLCGGMIMENNDLRNLTTYAQVDFVSMQGALVANNNFGSAYNSGFNFFGTEHSHFVNNNFHGYYAGAPAGQPCVYLDAASSKNSIVGLKNGTVLGPVARCTQILDQQWVDSGYMTSTNVVPGREACDSIPLDVLAELNRKQQLGLFTHEAALEKAGIPTERRAAVLAAMEAIV